MKAKIYSLLLITALIAFGCNPIEDQSLREKYFNNTGTPITVEELSAALSVTQPIPNSDDKVEGDQYVVITNNRPDIGGVWHIGTTTGEKFTTADHDTIIYTGNGTFDIYYVAISENEIVQSNSFSVEVTNCFDEYDQILSGARDKADQTAKKAWRVADGAGVIYNGMYGNWKYYPDFLPGRNSWGNITVTADMKEQTLEFEFKDHKVSIRSGSGAALREGNWAYTHENPEGVTGELMLSIPLMGQGDSWGPAFKGVETPYWILRISDDELLVCYPSTYNKSPAVEDWDIDATYFFFVPKE